MVVNNGCIEMKTKGAIDTMNELNTGDRIESQIAKARLRTERIIFEVERLAQAESKVAANFLIRGETRRDDRRRALDRFQSELS
jgi:hypothetical protein